MAAYITFGFPEEDPGRPEPINPVKFVRQLSHQLKFLGFFIDTRTMSITWPQHTRDQLRLYLTNLLDTDETPSGGRRLSPQSAATILGLVRHSATATLLGTYYTLSLQFSLNDNIRSSVAQGLNPASTRFWQRTHFSFSRETILDLRALLHFLPVSASDHFWSRPIGLVIPRESQFTVLGDASIEGLGGLLNERFPFMWRLTKSDLEAIGFIIPKDMQATKITAETTSDTTSEPWHINLLEFIVLIIDFWFIQVLAQTATPAVTSLVSTLRTDNTSALSWLKHAARTKGPTVQRLARLFQSMLSHAPVPVKLLSLHIAGSENHNADLLSRPSLAPSWASVIAQSRPPLDHRLAYQVPRKLLSVLLLTYRFPATADIIVERTTALWTLAPTTFIGGPSDMDTQSNYCRP